MFIRSIHFTLHTFCRGKIPAASDAFNIMNPVSHATSIHHVCVLWKTLDSCEERCQGSARQPYTPPANTWHHLGWARPRNISPCHWLSVTPSPVSSKWRSFYLRRPCPQQGSHSVTKDHAKLCRIKQTMAGSLCMHAGFTQESASFKEKLRRKRNGNLFFFILQKAFFFFLTY